MRAIQLFLLTAISAFAIAQTDPWREAAAVFGAHGKAGADGKYAVNYLRTDLQVQNASGMLLPPEMGLSSTATFTANAEGVAVDGEICATQPEIGPVIDDLRAAGIEIEALGNRFAGEQPAVYFIRFHGQGALGKLVQAIKVSIDELGKDRLISGGLNRTGAMPIVDWRAVSTALGTPVSPVGTSQVMRGESGGSFVCFGGCPCGRTQLIGQLNVLPQRLQTTIDEVRRSKISLNSIARTGQTVHVGIEGEGDAIRLATLMRRILSATEISK